MQVTMTKWRNEWLNNAADNRQPAIADVKHVVCDDSGTNLGLSSSSRRLRWRSSFVLTLSRRISYMAILEGRRNGGICPVSLPPPKTSHPDSRILELPAMRPGRNNMAIMIMAYNRCPIFLQKDFDHKFLWYSSTHHSHKKSFFILGKYLPFAKHSEP